MLRRLSLAAALALGLTESSCQRAGRPVFRTLPDGAFRLEWTRVDLPARARPGQRLGAVVRVRNVGEAAWPANGQGRPLSVRLGHRWFRGADALLAADYGSDRAELRRPVRPGEAVDVSATLLAPREPGDYVVQFDLLQEGVAWFADKGAARKYALVQVR